MNIKIVLNEPYPHGKACTNRVHYYAKGLTELNEQVEIIIPRAKRNTSGNAVNSEIRGIFENVPFVYTPGITTRTHSALRNKYYDMKGLIRAFFYLLKNRKNIDIILLVSNLPSHIILFKIVSLLTGSGYLAEKSEIPFKSKKINYADKVYIRNIYKLFDGFIVISNYLKIYFTGIARKDVKIHIVPILLNSDEFLKYNVGKPQYKKSIVYAGTLDENKDGALTLVKAFRLVHKKFPETKLIMIGSANHPSDSQKLNHIIDELDLQNEIVLTGYISREEMIGYMMNATVLVLAKPDNIQSKACFPTKLGEYLITGKPVIVTRVGEIPLYLKDGKNAWLAEPDNPRDFADRIVEAFSEENTARKLGMNGRKLAMNEFDYRSNTLRLKEFMHSLLL
jgi:glycosyltransferase involved in cell wall biosynthesis